MTIINISIQDLVQREVIYCVSSLIYTFTQENKLDEEQACKLWTAPIDYGAAKYELELERDAVFKHFCREDNTYYFGVRHQDYAWRIDPIHNDEEIAIRFSVARSTITEIKSGKRWNHLNPIPASVKKIFPIPKLLDVA